MQTNPILGRREIPRRERLQKSLIVLAVTGALLAGSWFFGSDWLQSRTLHLAAFGLAGLVGVAIAASLWFRKYEVPRSKADAQAIRERIDDDRGGRGWTSRIGYNLRRLLTGMIVMLGYGVALGGIGVLGFQIYHYLRYGQWDSISVLELALPYVPWLQNPESWFGLYRIATDAFDFMPASLALLLVGWLIAGFGAALRQRVGR